MNNLDAMLTKLDETEATVHRIYRFLGQVPPCQLVARPLRQQFFDEERVAEAKGEVFLRDLMPPQPDFEYDPNAKAEAAYERDCASRLARERERDMAERIEEGWDDETGTTRYKGQ